MRRTFISTLALACALAAGTAAVAPASVISTVASPAASAWPVAEGLQADPSFRKGVLPNGMRYAIRRNATPPGEASLRLRIDTGSLNEREDQRGLAHFLEHMVLNGTKNVPEGEFVKRLERHGLKFGPDTNAFTDFEQTVYKLDLPETDKDTVETALFLLREVADRATLDAAAIDRERGIILAEERTRATPQMRQVIDELDYLYRGQLLPSRIPIGLTEVIRTAPRERLLQFYNAFYRPENATLIAVGDFDAAEMERRITALFSDWKGEGPAGKAADEGQVARRQAEADLFVDPGVATRASIAFVRPADLAPDSRARRIRDTHESLALAVLNRRLERLAATQNPPPFIGAQAMSSQLAKTGEVTQLIAVTAPGGWRKGLETIDKEHRRLVQHGVTQTELQAEISRIRAALANAAAGAATRTNANLADGLIGTVNRDWTWITPEAALGIFDEAVKGIAPATVNAAARELFSGSGPLLYVTSPTAVEGAQQAVLAAYQQSTKVAVTPPAQGKALAWPYTSFGQPGTVAERQEWSDLGTTAVRFSNGVRLVVKPTSFRDDEVRVTVRVGDGRLDFAPGKTTPEWALSGGGFVLGGTRKLSAEELNEALAGKNFAANFSVSDDAFVLAGATTPSDFATQMQVLAAYVAEPAWQPTGWDRLRALAPTIHDQLAATPAGVFNRDAQALLRGGDPRWRTPSREEMQASSVADARAVLGEALASDPLEVIIVGDISVDEAVRQTAATFGALPLRRGTAAAPFALRFPKPTAEPVVLTHGGRPDQGLAMVAWPTTGLYPDPKLARTLNVLAQVFQLRLTDRIREEEGVSYSPDAGHTASDTFEGYGYLAAQIEAPPAALPKFLKEAQAIADSLRRSPPSADELQRALKPLMERVQRDRAGNQWWVQQLGGTSTDPRALEALRSQMADYQSVTPQAVQAAAKRYLGDTSAYRLLVLPKGN